MEWLFVVLRIYVALAVFQPYRDLEAWDNQSLKFKWRDRESNPGPLAPQAKSLSTRPPLLPKCTWGPGTSSPTYQTAHSPCTLRELLQFFLGIKAICLASKFTVFGCIKAICLVSNVKPSLQLTRSILKHALLLAACRCIQHWICWKKLYYIYKFSISKGPFTKLIQR